MGHRLLARLRALWRGMVRPSQLDAEMDEEMAFHVEMQADRLIRERNLDPVEARRQAYVAFGGVEKWKESGRDVRALQWLDHISLDCKLGVRMLVKHPSLTLIGVFSMTVAIAIGAAAFEVISQSLNPALPFENGHRVVSIEFATERPSVPEKAGVHDFDEWRSGLQSIGHVGAYRTVQKNLATAETYPEPVRIAEITAAAFALARTPPQLGRYLLPDDERDTGTSVVVIGYREWHRRFGGNPAIVGRTVTLNAVPHVVVGVMPEGFAFPLNHQFWIPLRANPAQYQRGQGPRLSVFGVLAAGLTRAEAEAELAARHQQAVAQFPDTYRRLRPIVLPYTLETLDIDRPVFVWALRVLQLLISALLVVVSVNLAILFYARTVTRLGEIAVRTALGASRARILGQLFVEGLVLSLLSAGAGILLADAALDWLRAMVTAVEQVPFWITFELSRGTVIYALGLALLAAGIVGVLPGLKTTSVRLEANLRALGGATGVRLGPMWTSMIVAQVAVAVMILPVALYVVFEVQRMLQAAPGFPVDEFVIAKVDPSRRSALIDRVEMEAGVSGVTFSSSIPGYEGDGVIAFEDPAAAAQFGIEYVAILTVDVRMFEVYGAGILAGRGFSSNDLGTATVVVNQSFAREYFGNQTVLGQRFSFTEREPAPAVDRTSFEIVGVVADVPSFPMSPGSTGKPTVYHPAGRDDTVSTILAVRFNGAPPANVVGRLRQIGAEMDATLPLRDVTLLADFYERNRSPWRLVSWVLTLVTVSVLLLSAAGIYALMSFTVAQRTREIGIRTALGGNPRVVLAGIFGRVLRQLTIGVVIGSVLSAALMRIANLSVAGAGVLVLTVGAIILAIGLMAAVGPARRSLRPPAMEALRTDA
jgi:putative ABC transport system permease protein